jgi:hypothetical protein
MQKMKPDRREERRLPEVWKECSAVNGGGGGGGGERRVRVEKKDRLWRNE